MYKKTIHFFIYTIIMYICVLLCSCHPTEVTTTSAISQEQQLVKNNTDTTTSITDNLQQDDTPIFTFPSDIDPVTTIYALTLDTYSGPFLYYNQGDARWADYMYGGQDPMKKYGCGPTVIAMFATSFSSMHMSPSEAADWCMDNGYWAPGSGSLHSIIPEGLKTLGFQVESIRPTLKAMDESLSEGKLLVTLMGKGTFTRQGHFLVITKKMADGTVQIADPASYDRTLSTWDPQLILNELKYGGGNGGPIWAVSIPPN